MRNTLFTLATILLLVVSCSDKNDSNISTESVEVERWKTVQHDFNIELSKLYMVDPKRMEKYYLPTEEIRRLSDEIQILIQDEKQSTQEFQDLIIEFGSTSEGIYKLIKRKSTHQNIVDKGLSKLIGSDQTNKPSDIYYLSTLIYQDLYSFVRMNSTQYTFSDCEFHHEIVNIDGKPYYQILPLLHDSLFATRIITSSDTAWLPNDSLVIPIDLGKDSTKFNMYILSTNGSFFSKGGAIKNK